MKVKFFTLGCKVNQYETQALKEEFLRCACVVTKDKEADIYVINTCTVTSRADRKSKEYILKAKKENPRAKVAVCGCLAQLNKSFLEKLGVDYIIPQEDKQSLVDIVLKGNVNHKDIWSLGISRFSNARVFVKVQDGCDSFCSFCKIPYIRGRSVSRRKKEILAEIRRLSSHHREVVLCGINLALYGKDLGEDAGLDNLVEDILRIDSLQRVRLSSLQADLISDRLISLFSHPKLCPHLHLPFQSGDDFILSEMNKPETVSLYEDIVRKARSNQAHLALSCDIMVGFPRETQESFRKTVDFLKRVKPMRMHIFTFSARQETKFANIKSRNSKVVHERFNLLRDLAVRLSFQYHKKFLGKTLYMVAEEKKSGYVSGYTQNYIKVYVKGELSLGQIYPVTITEVGKDRVLADIS
ncbi:MAG: tRNA (N(6)-L-threonylcarbamoyladenosine(37)-C(2))-methylthiotransferase MtaB [Candidatus Omnitrophota bacterium]|nr:MAG: tRNA (N(6)-L-threonylcarbamoyladenosine(37)-C(2))-methylthiotransferase MtaB [Candidatus Omnitrophota bacterium]